eukprot:NODE_17_length_4595_cov_21.435988_g14_i0.p1 GENE.NODE_17_length_4595_cov_21.435988_g14_i0~~NODE_17_length_4595_cov_21.435988_g14_i0.p1  ORF type:complete len:1383 (+),score=251.24 NODE_17_length_4595_cov_21.435988_g14_i0:62-4210(+)
MSESVEIPSVIRAVQRVTGHGSETETQWVKPYQAPSKPEGFHQFVLFLKPELTDPMVDLKEVLELIVETFAAQKVSVGAVRVLAGPYLQRFKIIAEYYGLIDKVSRMGVGALSTSALEALRFHYQEELEQGAQVVGAHQFLELNQHFTALSLSAANEAIVPKRLGVGTYSIFMGLGDEKFIILNAFYPMQLLSCTRLGSAVVAFELRAPYSLSWANLQTQLCGATDPAKADAGSLRHTLYINQNSLKIKVMNRASNGLGFSGGPLRAMADVQRFFSPDHGGLMPPDQTAFGQLLLSRGLTLADVSVLATNPSFTDSENRLVTAFDLTEEIDAEPAVEKLQGFFDRKAADDKCETSPIIAAIQRVTVNMATTDNVWVVPYDANLDRSSKHHFILLLKPETVGPNVNHKLMLDLIFEALSQNEIEVGAIRALGSTFLERYQIMSQNYGVVHSVSIRGHRALPELGKKNLERHFKNELSSGARILGAHQFLTEFHQFSPLSLGIMNDTLGRIKLCPGAYAVCVPLPSGGSCVVLNAFHPAQLLPYSTPGHAVVVLECFSKRSWVHLRQVLGPADPMLAPQHTLRGIFASQRAQLRIPEVSVPFNCIHLSSGPLEAMVEIQRFFRSSRGLLPVSATGFGQLLIKNGLSHSEAAILASNPQVRTGRTSNNRISAFDMTKDLDDIPALRIVIDHFKDYDQDTRRWVTPLVAAVLDVTGPFPDSDNVWVVPYNPATEKSGYHHFPLVLKPEALSRNVAHRAVFEMVLKFLLANDLEIGAIRVLGGKFVDRFNIMAQNYGIVNQISRLGPSVLPEVARIKMEKHFRAALKAGARVLGAHQFLEEFKDFSPLTLAVLSVSIGRVQIADGAFAVNIPLAGGGSCIVLNAFHPLQLLPYVTPGRCIVVIECLSKRSWVHLRQLNGATDPHSAAPNSLRAAFVRNRETFRIAEVSSAFNCTKMSPGPLEALVELQRLFRSEESLLPLEQTGMGQLLLESKLSPADIAVLAANPLIPTGFQDDRVPAFEFTAGLDASACVPILKRFFVRSSEKIPDLSAVIAALHRVTEQPAEMEDIWVTPYTADKPTDLHQFVFFFKPEATSIRSSTVDIKGILEIALQILISNDVEIGAIRVLGGPYLEKHNIIARHYGVLNQVSTQGQSAITPGAKEKLLRTFSSELECGAEVMGGHQFLKEHTDFTAQSLSAISDTVGSKKMGGGTYAFPLHVKDWGLYILLNAFHPNQLLPFTSPGRGIIVMEGLSRRPWSELRQKICGATNPFKAAEGSIRSTLLKEKERLKLAHVTQAHNCVHMSAGPLEGMVEVLRFFQSGAEPMLPSQTVFGKLLEESEITSDVITQLASNPQLPKEGGGTVSAFDATEEMDARDSVEVFRNSAKL